MTTPSRLPRIGRRGVLAATCTMLAAPAIVSAQGTSAGVALVIGNSKYKWEASLPNVKRDAPDIAKAFQALGLKTELLQDAGQGAMRAALDKFASVARGANLAAFYFAGHGASWDKDTYLVPEDGDLSDPGTVQNLVQVRAVGTAMKQAQHRLLVFDNCRNNPADGWRQRAAVASSRVTKTELAATALQGPNTLVMFSTAPGRVAVDGPAGENSPFAAAFLRQLSAPSVNAQALPAKLRRDLLIATEGRQVLWDQSTYDQPFLLANSGNRQSAAGTGPLPRGSTQLVELPNAYAFAREKGLLLPPGLIALRPGSGSPHDQKIGSFKTTGPLLLIVISVSGSTAEIIFSARDWWSVGEGGASGNIWRYSTGALSGRELEFSLGHTNGNQEMPVTFTWRDANSGSYTSRHSFGASGVRVQPAHDSPFTRLD